MDEIDRAQNQEIIHTAAAIHAAKNRNYTKLVHTGYCHNCDAEVEAPKLFCDGQCATEWEQNKNRHRHL